MNLNEVCFRQLQLERANKTETSQKIEKCFKKVISHVSFIASRFPIVRFFPRASERRVLPIVGVCKTSSHLHLLIFTSSHLHIFLSSHLLLIFSSSHLLIFTSSYPHIFSSSLIFSSSHLLIFTSSHLHIFSSSHLLIFTSSHIFSHLLTSSHIFSHLLTHLLTSSHIFSHLLTSSHTSTHIFSHLHISHLLLLPSCPLLLFYFSFEGGSRGSAHETARNATLSHEMRVDRQKLR